MTNTNLPKSVTLHDVAREAGVSLITASRALSNPGMVSEKTIARVQQAVAATGYIPNLLAGGLKSKRSLMVAALVPNIAVAQFLPTVKALTDALDAAGYQLILGQTGYDHAREEALLGTMISRRPDGIVVTGLVHSQAARERLRRAGIPVVETWDLSDRPVDMSVGFSHVKVGSSVAGYFLGKGWRRLGIATGDDHRASVRREGFVSTVGHEVPTVVVPAPSSLALGRQALAGLLEQDPRIQAIYCSSDQLAQGVMVEALARGLRIPEDLAICGFGDADFAAHLKPSLTTVHVDGAAIGALAARLLLDRCQGKAVSQPVIDVGFRVIEREST
ncbi:Transcriptional regulator, LacI family [Cupriavidus taiwanensis]|uniref:Transcriptional regulator, LacI family n=1 Tax=Cupriavidus taiwanensis TaxID=164546 RepID=A0A976AV54_9BURK|nr:LacI family DNA-binding transcriptional regulator [Cupriavidus taiwanensis]SOZ52469.1 Transcriptional regulator, LacI family [Cupriavidus taiwanensis]SOZ53893.1 Transcriptional regulator, LacI family [Cupriavidus taiwanensis]SOZ56427.1 Transcriptional regulator, LacI family [Cupriavidus taiwanensis]SOZ97817.1 Transcriptional regulator, LacI family [Cupriavidus taiwanensis]SPA04708.1 Transcriptional regulator, LacI family [Cupriavidus taiwanensis]